MNSYTHYYLASLVEPIVQPDLPGDYYLGAIIPDVRYAAHVPRQQTHLSQERICAYRSPYPHLDSFLQGYQVHCLLDEIDLTRVIGTAFPLNWIGRVTHRKFSQQQLAILTELHFLQDANLGWKIHVAHNEILSDLGIQPAQTMAYLEAMREYLPAPSVETALSSFQKIGFFESPRFEKYYQAYQSLERNPLLKAILLWSVRHAKVDEFSVRYVQRRLKEEKALAERD
jgi:hypothetical protein